MWTVLPETVDLTEFGSDQIQIEFLDPGSASTIFQLSDPQLYWIGAQEDIGPCNGPWHPVPLP